MRAWVATNIVPDGIEDIFSIALCEHVSWRALTLSLDHGPIHY